MKVRLCELCKEAAAVFCPADAAFLCRGCDARVHGANFLVARHVRQSLRATCHDEDDDSIVDDTLSSSSSACNSSTTKKGTTTTSSSCNCSTSVNDRQKKSQRALVNRSNAKGVFVGWCGRLGLGGGENLAVVVRTACAALKVCSERLTFLPLRVGLAAALWMGLRLGGRSRSSLLQTWKVAKRLEEVSGVPARVILAVGSKLERAARVNGRQKRDHRRDLEEGWAESSPARF